MPMLAQPSDKYRAASPIPLVNRQWPSKTLQKAPRWLSTDLRDGSQALPTPLSLAQKLSFFALLVDIGFKEIEICIPASSTTDYDFTRHLVQNPALVPDDVFLQIMCPCRDALIHRTVEAATGAKNAIFHLYLPTSELFREIVLGISEQGAIDLAVRSTKLVRSLTKDNPSNKTRWQLALGLEAFQDTPLDFTMRLCGAVKDAWGPSEADPIIFTLAATVEVSMPNRFADQVEYFSTHIGEREKVSVCVHPHNDRGCAVAASEQAQLAGADRVEGCLLGNGERTGNVDLITLALNLYSSGINPGLNLSNLNEITEKVSGYTKIPVYPRTPYSGSLVFCTFAGSHQDALKKGHAARKTSNIFWDMPYMPIDPADIGREDEPIIRITSQSGKGGAAWIIENATGLRLPRGMQPEFAAILQREAERAGRELSTAEVITLFEIHYKVRGSQPSAAASSMGSRQFMLSDQAFLMLKKVASSFKDSDAQGLTDILTSAGLKVTVKETVTQELKGSFAVFIQSSINGRSDYQWSVGTHVDRLNAMIISVINALPQQVEQASTMNGGSLGAQGFPGSIQTVGAVPT